MMIEPRPKIAKQLDEAGFSRRLPQGRDLLHLESIGMLFSHRSRHRPAVMRPTDP